MYAILSGVFFGLVVAFGVWRANLNLSSKISPTPVASNGEIKKSPSPTDLTITLAKPDNFKVSTTDKIEVSGVTKAGSWVVVSAESEDFVTTADATGSFSLNTPLISGVNQILVSAYDTNQKSATTQVMVVYSKDFENSTPTPEEEKEEDKDATDSIRQKVQEKVKETMQSPKAYIGIITDISSNTIQMNKFTLNNNGNGKGQEINQVSFDTTTTFVKYLNNESKTVKREDVAIGDFIIAMGYTSTNQVLTAQRILITDPIKATDRISYIGNIGKTAKILSFLTPAKEGKFTLEFPDTSKLTATKDGQTVKVKTDSLVDQDEAIITGSFKKEKFVIRRLHLTKPVTLPSPTPKKAN